MNQIFRVIWNHATQSWVAVSELTKAHKKQSRNSLKAVLGGALVLLSINTAEAAAVGIESTNGPLLLRVIQRLVPMGFLSVLVLIQVQGLIMLLLARMLR